MKTLVAASKRTAALQASRNAIATAIAATLLDLALADTLDAIRAGNVARACAGNVNAAYALLGYWAR